MQLILTKSYRFEIAVAFFDVSPQTAEHHVAAAALFALVLALRVLARALVAMNGALELGEVRLGALVALERRQPAVGQVVLVAALAAEHLVAVRASVNLRVKVAFLVHQQNGRACKLLRTYGARQRLAFVVRQNPQLGCWNCQFEELDSPQSIVEMGLLTKYVRIFFFFTATGIFFVA